LHRISLAQRTENIRAAGPCADPACKPAPGFISGSGFPLRDHAAASLDSPFSLRARIELSEVGAFRLGAGLPHGLGRRLELPLAVAAG